MGTLQPIKTRLVAVIAIIAVSLGAFLLGSSARAAEISVNDDYSGTLNSTIVTTLPISGSYTILASAYLEGGMSDVTVEPANETDLTNQAERHRKEPCGLDDESCS